MTQLRHCRRPEETKQGFHPNTERPQEQATHSSGTNRMSASLAARAGHCAPAGSAPAARHQPSTMGSARGGADTTGTGRHCQTGPPKPPPAPDALRTGANPVRGDVGLPSPLPGHPQPAEVAELHTSHNHRPGGGGWNHQRASQRSSHGRCRSGEGVARSDPGRPGSGPPAGRLAGETHGRGMLVEGWSERWGKEGRLRQ